MADWKRCTKISGFSFKLYFGDTAGHYSFNMYANFS